MYTHWSPPAAWEAQFLYFRLYTFLHVGFNTAVHISDLLELCVEHFLDDHQRIRRRFLIKKQKRGIQQEVVVNDSIQETFEEYLTEYPEISSDIDHFVFFNTKAKNFMQPIRHGQAWKVLTTIHQEVGLCGSYGTHSLRKTCGYHARLQGVDLALIMHKLNHESIATTKRYLSITDTGMNIIPYLEPATKWRPLVYRINQKEPVFKRTHG